MTPDSLADPDLLCHVGSPLAMSYQSFFEEECRTIISLLLGVVTAASPSPGPVEGSSLWLDPAGPTTSTPLHASLPLHERALDSARPAGRLNTDAGGAAAWAQPTGTSRLSCHPLPTAAPAQ
ncbi:hypothetical protein AV530_003755 [Patagioenas fasciata monilis]|uniref:Uncharacterized protein n=1 Tax=Patagioenas fasciata monilis TaxID=372326 RepID=A0A1V4KYT4_PATFA|nr:hypothetical protein AV530_003755 [Patagioenas fasciata monilis]